MAERQLHRSSDEIRRDIEGTRTELRDTVTALERKLSLGQVVDEVWGRLGGRRAAGDAVSNLGGTIRDHPVPLALMGLGIAWLAVDSVTGSDREDARGGGVGPGTYGRAEGRVGPYRGDTAHRSSEPSSMDKAKQKASEVAEKAKGMLADAKDSFGSSDEDDSGNGEAPAWYGADEGDGGSDRTGEAADRARHAAERARKGARRGVEKARHGLRSAMDEQPLALGAVAFGLGLASGLAAPTSRWEDEAMGAAADVVKDEAGSMAKDATRDVKQVVASVASDAKQAAKEEMHERDLDFDGIKDRAKESSERTEERLTD